MRIKDNAYIMAKKLLLAALRLVEECQSMGTKAALRKNLKKALQKQKLLRLTPRPYTTNQDKLACQKWSDIDKRNTPDLSPLGIFTESDVGESFTSVVTDSIGKSSLFGGVGTALILGTLIANRRKQPLRIITRTEAAFAVDYSNLIDALGISLEQELVLSYSPRGTDSLSISRNSRDLFITTSWWSTYGCLQRVSPSQILYLLQEDERCFYPNGDLMLESEQIMRNDNIRFAINSKLLWDHLLSEGFSNLATQGIWFEPAFRQATRDTINPHHSSSKKKFFFYARPGNPRNLYRTGVNAINEALSLRIIDPDTWEILLVGSNLHKFSFDDGTLPTLITGLTWNQYLTLLAEVDVGLSLMATPHPSYPPLDLAAAGAVVVTNSFGIKKSLASYSKNIISCEPRPSSIVEGIRRGIALAADTKQRNANYSSNSISLSWVDSLAQIVDIYS